MSSVVQAKPKALEVEYQTGFGNQHATEALPGALPEGRNSPQKAPYGLYAELLSGTAFTAPRDQNARTWLYRIRPSADQNPYVRRANGLWRSSPFDETAPTPDRLRWSPLPIPDAPTDFIDGMITMAGNGDLASHTGLGIHLYCANESMRERFFYNADGELLIVPQQGRLVIYTEMGILGVAPGEISVIPRGIRFRVELPDGPSRGYVCENYGAAMRLPELGPLGSNGLANPRDFETPVAAFEDRDGDFELLCKFAGNLWTSRINRSPLDVVAWHGNCAPYKYDLSRFNTMGTISFDHPDPSIFTVLTSPSGSPVAGTANVDFVIFPARWLVAEDTFRPPWFHRNFMSEFMGLVHGVYDAKAEGFLPGGASLHNCMSPHGPDTETFKKASTKELSPERISDTLAFMFETKVVCRPSEYAMSSSCLQDDYATCWEDMPKNFSGKP